MPGGMIAAMASDEYVHQLLKWRSEMEANLHRENNWLALAGLFWLRPGINTCGAAPECDLALQEPAPRLLGTFQFDGSNVSLRPEPGEALYVNGGLLQGEIQLQPDDAAEPSFIVYGQMRMVIVRRSHGVGVRLWDNRRLQRHDLPKRAWFDPDEAFYLDASYIPYPDPLKASIPNSLGEMTDDLFHGYVAFGLRGTTFRLNASRLEDSRLFLTFKDQTSGTTTYPSGRYLYTEAVREDGHLWLDFNRAYNPPCAFTEYATCGFPPKENMLEIVVEAGERYARGDAGVASHR